MKKNKKIMVLLLIALITVIIIVGSYSIFSMKLLGSEVVPVVPAGNVPVWDDKNNEISFNQYLINEDGKNHGNVIVVIEFYKDSDFKELIETKTLYNLKMKNGELYLNFTTKLPERPHSFGFEVCV